MKTLTGAKLSEYVRGHSARNSLPRIFRKWGGGLIAAIALATEDFRPRHLRMIGARDLGLDKEEQALLSLLRSWRIKQSRAVA